MEKDPYNYCPKGYKIILKPKIIEKSKEKIILPLNGKIIIDNINCKIPFSFILKGKKEFYCFILFYGNLTIKIPNTNIEFTTKKNDLIIKKIKENFLISSNKIFEINIEENNINLKINKFNFNEKVEISNFSIIPLKECSKDFILYTDLCLNYGTPKYLLDSPFKNKNMSYFDMIENNNESMLISNYCNCFTFIGKDKIECNNKKINIKRNKNICITENNCEIIIKGEYLEIEGKNNFEILELFNGNRNLFGWYENNKIKLNIFPICIYENINFSFNDTIDINYNLNNKDYKEILNFNGYNCKIKELFLFPNNFNEGNIIIIYKLYFLNNKKEKKCIYFSVIYDEKIKISCFNKINKNLIPYKSIYCNYKVKLIGNKIKPEFEINLDKGFVKLKSSYIEIEENSEIYNLLIPYDGYYSKDKGFLYEFYKILDIKNNDNNLMFYTQLNRKN